MRRVVLVALAVWPPCCTILWAEPVAALYLIDGTLYALFLLWCSLADWLLSCNTLCATAAPVQLEFCAMCVFSWVSGKIAGYTHNFRSAA